MKRTKLFIALSTLTVCSSSLLLAETPTTPLETLRRAPDSASAVKAYEEARAFDASSNAPDLALVHRMIDLGVPELAEKQAQNLADLATRDAGVWAALAVSSAKHDHHAEAFAQIKTAAKLSNTDPFVIHTAAQFAAWSENLDNKSTLSEQAAKDIESARAALADKPDFQKAYRQAAIAGNIPVPAQAPEVALTETPSTPSESSAIDTPADYYPLQLITTTDNPYARQYTSDDCQRFLAEQRFFANLAQQSDQARRDYQYSLECPQQPVLTSRTIVRAPSAPVNTSTPVTPPKIARSNPKQ